MLGKKVIDYRFAIFGRIQYTDHFINELSRLGYPKPIVIVSPDNEYKRDKTLLSDAGMFGDLENLELVGLCDLYKLEDINSLDTISILKDKKCNIGISINCRSIIKKPIINFFSGVILNIHGAQLPLERGGAGASWKILNNIDDVVSTLHYLTEGIDDGDILLTKKEEIDVSLAYPEDILKKSHIASKRLISDFLQKLKSRYHFDRVSQDNDDSIYLSRLYTRVNGAINWNWDCIEIERFIRAFGRPYEGAWSFCRNKKIHIMDAIIDDDKEYHPFLSGRVVTVLNDNTVRIVAGRSAIRIRKIRIDESIVNAGDYLKAGDIIYSNSDDIIKACNHKPTTSSMLK